MDAKVKVWIEDENRNLLFGDGKTQVLELIEQTGSIKEAAEKVGMNYKKAWSHVKILQENIQDELVIVNKGNQGGTKLTPKAKELIDAYKLLKDDVNIYAQKRFEELFSNGDKKILNEAKNEI